MLFIKSTWVWLVVIIIYLVGLVGFLTPDLHNLFIWLIPFNIIFALVILVFGIEKFTYHTFIFFLICFFFGYFIELAGTKTGLIFGSYAYGGSLGPKLFGVPLLIGVNWFFMVYTSLALTSTFTKSAWAQIGVAPLLMVVYDFFLEPFAMKHDMWNWSGGVVPLQNYVAWYAGGFILCAIAIFGKFDTKNRFAPGLFVVQALFFVLLLAFG